jgi:AcrR family transcriptional regulator
MSMEKTNKPGVAPQKASARTAGAVKSGPAEITERILDCAREVLVRQGYTGFTVRAVAEAAGISPGNVAYHFPSKQYLLRAVVEHMVAGYATQFEELLTNTKLSPDQGLKSLTQWLLADAVTEESVRTFRELWAISLHDDVVREAIDDLYNDLMSGVVELLQRSYPDVELQTLQEVVQILALFSEGSIVLYGTCKDRVVPHDHMIKLALRLLDLHAPELGSDAQ